MRMFNADKVAHFMEWLKTPPDVPIESKAVTRSIRSAQTQVEQQNFEIRKDVLKYDDVLNRQRKVIYGERRRVLEGADLHEQIRGMINEVIAGYVAGATSEGFPEEWDLDQLWRAFRSCITERAAHRCRDRGGRRGAVRSDRGVAHRDDPGGRPGGLRPARGGADPGGHARAGAAGGALGARPQVARAPLRDGLPAGGHRPAGLGAARPAGGIPARGLRHVRRHDGGHQGGVGRQPVQPPGRGAGEPDRRGGARRGAWGRDRGAACGRCAGRGAGAAARGVRRTRRAGGRRTGRAGAGPQGGGGTRPVRGASRPGSIGPQNGPAQNGAAQNGPGQGGSRQSGGGARQQAGGARQSGAGTPPTGAVTRRRPDAVRPQRRAATARATRPRVARHRRARSPRVSNSAGRASCSIRPRRRAAVSSTGATQPPTRSPTSAATTCAPAGRAGSTSAATATRATPDPASRRLGRLNIGAQPARAGGPRPQR